MNSEPQHKYIAIDLKSFYASVECVDRGLDPLTTNLVVADLSRTSKTICLAVSPSLKSYGISGRARLFEVIQRVQEINEERLRLTQTGHFTGQSISAPELKAHPNWEVKYYAAAPRMARYLEYSHRIYQIYLSYVSAEDIHVYSVDEVFMDITRYLNTYGMTAHELAIMTIRVVLRQTGITATAGIGTNLYLAKIAMDIVAKHIPADSDGVRIAELDEMSYRRRLWDYQPLTDFWRIGKGIANRLSQCDIYTMGQLARASLQEEDLLYHTFGVNAELIIDHAWGWEPCTITDIKQYRPTANSFSNGQVLTQPYDTAKARIVVQEMAEASALRLVSKRLVSNKITLSIGYDIQNLTHNGAKKPYAQGSHTDHYGRTVPKPGLATEHLCQPTASTQLITQAALLAYDRAVTPGLLIRRLNLTTANVIPEDEAQKYATPLELNLFDDPEARTKAEIRRKETLKKEKKIQQTMLSIKQEFGKNSVLRSLDFQEGATARQRNTQIGGHKA